MKLAFGQACANRLAQWLGPLSERVMVAGSIRRGRPEVGDVDLVIQPKRVQLRNLLGAVDGYLNETAVAIIERTQKEGWRLVKAGDEIIQIQTAGRVPVQVDFFFATPATWASVVMCRTGSVEHNVWLCSQASRRGLHWKPNVGLMRGTEQLPTESEREIYERLGLTYLEPHEREAGLLPQ